jgi:hypothetical protein
MNMHPMRVQYLSRKCDKFLNSKRNMVQATIPVGIG